MNPSRRFLLKSGVLALAAVGGAGWGPAFMRRALFAADGPLRSAGKGKVLICIFQRGAADGLSMVAPVGDADYYKLRNEIALPRPDKKLGDESPVDLDGFFAMHRAMRPLAELFHRKELAVIHACGSPSPTRSHFDGQDLMESGVVRDKSVPSGWLNRALLAAPAPAKKTPFRAISLTSAMPRSLLGDQDVLAIPDLRSFGVRGASVASVATGTGDGFEGLYKGAVDEALGGAGKESFAAMDLLRKANPTSYTAEHGAQYPTDSFGRSLEQIAQLIKADIGLQIAFAEVGGWDTHTNQGAANGQLAGHLTDFSRALAALYQDLGDGMNDVVVLTMTEFGRSVRQNGNKGTDHGHGACFLAMGGNVNGGKVLGDWPGLSPDKLYEERDLAVTTDFRNVFAEVAQKHLGVAKLESVFPGYKIDPKQSPGVLRG